MTSNHDDSESSCDVIMCVAVVLLTLGVAAVGVAYLLPYDRVTDEQANSARQTESAQWRAWTVFTVWWSAGLTLIAISVIIITSVVVYTNCPCRRVEVISRRGDEMPLSAADWTQYGSSELTGTRH